MTNAERMKLKIFGDVLCKNWGLELKKDLDPTSNAELKQVYFDALTLLQELTLIAEFSAREGVTLHPPYPVLQAISEAASQEYTHHLSVAA